MMKIPSREDILGAHERIRPHIIKTDVRRSSIIDEMVGASLFFKCENLQHVRAFKFRGATNAVLSLSDAEVANGVCTHSSGNHAQALALAAKNRGVPAHIVMPRTSPCVKIGGVRLYGGEITFCEPTLEARETTLAKVRERTGATFIHPYDDPVVIAGAATAAKELFDEVPSLDIIMAPVGGGGLLSGTGLSARYFGGGAVALGAEPEMADDAFRSLEAGRIIPSVDPRTICDGLLTSLSQLTFTIIRDNSEGIVTASESAIIGAMRLMTKALDMVVEPSAAVPLAALMEGKLDVAGCRVGIIVSGGNLDSDKY